MMTKSVLLALILTGSVSKTNIQNTGIIGVRLNAFSGGIVKVHDYSPAAIVGMQKKDVVIEVNGKKRHNVPLGQPGSVVVVKVQRKKEILEFVLVRVDVAELHDKQLNKHFGVKEYDP